MNKYGNEEFFEIIEPVLNVSEFQELNNIRHHGMTRLDHCVRVAYYSYKVTKFLGLDYKLVTKAAVLHDFFTNEVEDMSLLKRFTKHPQIACDNACKYFDLNDKQKDIILKHMFPITLVPSKYIETYIVDFVDDVAAIYERCYSFGNEFRAAIVFLFLLLIDYFKFPK